MWWGANRLCRFFCVDCVGSLADAHLAGLFVSWGVCGWNMRRRWFGTLLGPEGTPVVGVVLWPRGWGLVLTLLVVGVVAVSLSAVVVG